MRIERADMDYYIYITEEEGRKISIKEKIFGNFMYYPWVADNVVSDLPNLNENLGLTCSRNGLVPGAPGQLTFKRGENDEYLQDINVRVFTGRMWDLIEGKMPYIMTRYDRENKVWIFLEEPRPSFN